jgi:hypothetical protein
LFVEFDAIIVDVYPRQTFQGLVSLENALAVSA